MADTATLAEYVAVVSGDEQIAIPSDVLERMGVRAGDRIQVKVQGSKAILSPAQTEENPFAKFAGCLGGFSTMEEILAWQRDMRGHDPEEL